MNLYRFRRPTVEARQWDGIFDSEWQDWLGNCNYQIELPNLRLRFPDETVTVYPTDWIVSPWRGSFFVCSDREFHQNYEPVEAEKP